MTPARFHLTSILDHLKGTCYVWACQAEMPDGALVDGSVQADYQGEGVMPETFEQDDV